MYKKSIILIQDKRFEQFIKLLMRKKKKEIETGLPLLSDLYAIKNDLHQNKNTINIRGEFGSFVKEYGLPYMMIIDYQIDFGLSSNDDPDHRKLVRTFLLAYTILANAKGFDNATANIVFIADKKLSSTMQQYVKYPLFLLDQIRTKDDRINAIIDSFAANKEKVKHFFKISYIFKPDKGDYVKELERLEKIIDAYDKITAPKPETETEQPEEMISDDVNPADVICRATIEKIIINGEVNQISADQKNQYLEKNIHLMGALTVKTLPAVRERILSTFTTLAKINPFRKDEKIFIHVPDTSLIDGSFASSMGTFLTTVLSEYTGISINIGKTNFHKVKKSAGYIAIKDFIIKNL